MTPEKKRIRRTPEQMIADLQAEIERVKTRAAAKEMKASPAAKSALLAIRALDKGLDAAAVENNSLLRHALADARKPLAEYCETQGLRLPKPRLPRGRRPSA
jgi:cell division septum initiation protein DivIVA